MLSLEERSNLRAALGLLPMPGRAAVIDLLNHAEEVDAALRQERELADALAFSLKARVQIGPFPKPQSLQDYERRRGEQCFQAKPS